MPSFSQQIARLHEVLAEKDAEVAVLAKKLAECTLQGLAVIDHANADIAKHRAKIATLEATLQPNVGFNITCATHKPSGISNTTCPWCEIERLKQDLAGMTALNDQNCDIKDSYNKQLKAARAPPKKEDD